MHLTRLSTACALAALLSVDARAAEPTSAAAPSPAPEPALAAPEVVEGAASASAAPAGAAPASADPAATDAPGEAGADADAPDDAEIDQEVQAESAELEQMRAAEERAHPGEPAVPEDPAARAASRLGLESPLRLRLRDAFGRERGAGPDAGAGRIAGLPEIDHDLRTLQAEYDIPIEVNAQVVQYVRFFQAPLVRKHFVKWLGRSSKYIPTFRAILREEGLPEDTVYLAMIESGFANLATSRAKAVGPWQFIPATGKRMGLKQDFWIDERRDPEKAARAASKYLKELFGQTGDWRLAWAGYNAGVGKIFRARARGYQDFWAMAAAPGRGRKAVLRPETKGYVPKLMACAIVAKHPDAFGFTREEIEPEQWQAYDVVRVEHAAPLGVVAEAAGVTERELLELNPELRRTCTPPRAYALKVPRGQGEVFAKAWPEIAHTAGKLAFAQHHVGRGESLKTIAARFKVDQASIVRMNGLRPGRRIKAGTELVIPLNAAARGQGMAFASREPPPEPEKAPARRVEARSAAQRANVGEPPAGRGRATVEVRSGDTLWSIAQRFGVAVEELCRWNQIGNLRRHKLQVGRQLVVYPKTARAEVAPAGQPG